MNDILRQSDGEIEAKSSIGGRARRRLLKVLVWAVMPPNTAWRGEGIAQSIENLLLYSAEDIEYNLVISAEHFPVVSEVLSAKRNVRIVTYGYSLRTPKSYDDVERLLYYTGPGGDWKQRVVRKMERLGDLFERILRIFFGPVLYLTVWKAIANCDLIFNPSPVYSLLRFKKKKKVFGFWDPFVFEYSAFGNSRWSTLRLFMWQYYIKADLLITQSRANEYYLTNVLGLQQDKIWVIHNGSPDYSEIYQKFVEKQASGTILDRFNVLQYWPRKKLKGRNREGALSLMLTDTLNVSVLFRLQKSLSDQSRIIIVSTQYRPYKGFEALFALLDHLLSVSPEYDFRFVFTAEFPEKLWNMLSGKYSWAVERIYEMSRLSGLQHACLYKISDLALHPSFVEGGPTPYPASEAASLGIPSLTNIGRHTREMVERDGAALSETVADFTKKEEAVAMIRRLLDDRDAVARNVSLLRQAKVDWADTSRIYAQAFRGLAESISK